MDLECALDTLRQIKDAFSMEAKDKLARETLLKLALAKIMRKELEKTLL